ncbi:MAG: DUF1636 domain-containing protein [Minwuia sp.]|nr:DUF1636 domain-containing protein [Minwuia sp.]
MTATLTVCETCNFAPETKRGPDGQTGGEMLCGLVEQVADGVSGVATRRHACLMGCDHHCNVGLSAPGKITYVMGSFAPEAASAAALVAFAELYDASETGQVPYKQWPQGVKGHFVSRVPPLPADET